jgi:hypothetical protein
VVLLALANRVDGRQKLGLGVLYLLWCASIVWRMRMNDASSALARYPLVKRTDLVPRPVGLRERR